MSCTSEWLAPMMFICKVQARNPKVTKLSLPRPPMTTHLPRSLQPRPHTAYPGRGKRVARAGPNAPLLHTQGPRFLGELDHWLRRPLQRRWSAAVALATAAVAVACSPSASAKSSTDSFTGESGSSRRDAAPDSISERMDHARILGESSARIWFIMLSDFQCPYCKQFHDQSFAALRQQYVTTGKVRMAYINYPLPSHANAWPAAETAMCAGLQGKFWSMHDALFAGQSAWAERKDAPTRARLNRSDSRARHDRPQTLCFDAPGEAAHSRRH